MTGALIPPALRPPCQTPEGDRRGARHESAGACGRLGHSAVPPSVNLVVATPCFGGQISVLYAASLFKLQKLVRTYSDFTLKVLFKDGDALITRARASLISQFLDDPTATHLLFVDADIGFEPEQVLRLIECGADMCAAVYPIKRIDWDKVQDDDRSRAATIRPRRRLNTCLKSTIRTR